MLMLYDSTHMTFSKRKTVEMKNRLVASRGQGRGRGGGSIRGQPRRSLHGDGELCNSILVVAIESICGIKLHRIINECMFKKKLGKIE